MTQRVTGQPAGAHPSDPGAEERPGPLELVTLYGKSPALTAQARRGDGGDRRGTARTGLEDLISGSDLSEVRSIRHTGLRRTSSLAAFRASSRVRPYILSIVTNSSALVEPATVTPEDSAQWSASAKRSRARSFGSSQTAQSAHRRIRSGRFRYEANA